MSRQSFEEAVRDFLKYFPARIDEYEHLLTKNPLFIERTRNIGNLTAADVLNWGISGPMLRVPLG